MIDRGTELARLREAIAGAPQLVVLRGRRRVGKSFLLTHALARQRGVFFQADEQDERAHLDMFAREVGRLLGPRVPLRFESWDQALETVGELARERPRRTVLDEFRGCSPRSPRWSRSCSGTGTGGSATGLR